MPRRRRRRKGEARPKPTVINHLSPVITSASSNNVQPITYAFSAVQNDQKENKTKFYSRRRNYKQNLPSAWQDRAKKDEEYKKKKHKKYLEELDEKCRKILRQKYTTKFCPFLQIFLE